MKFLCILLKSDQKRVNHVNTHLLQYIPNLEIIDAIEGKTNELEYYLGDRDIKEKILKICRRGQLACLLSHVEAWKKMINENIEECIILEDDSVILKDFKKKFEEIYSILDNDTDLLYLYVHPDCKKENEGLISKGYFTYGTVGYYITKKLASELILFFKKNIYHTLDESLAWFLDFYKKTYYCVNQNLIETHGNLYYQYEDVNKPLGSTINETNEYKNSSPILSFFIDEGNYLFYPCCTVLDNFTYDDNPSKEKYLNDKNVLGFTTDGKIFNKLLKFNFDKNVNLYIKK